MKKYEKNPSKLHPTPPFNERKQTPPESEKQMKEIPDHGEQTYIGNHLFDGKTILITGGDSGIGKAVAIAFARERTDIVISYLSSVEDEDAKDTKKWVEKAGRKCLLIKGDITSSKHCKKIIGKTIAKFNKIDVLINNAAYQMQH